MLSDTYDYFEKEKEIKQETGAECGKLVVSLCGSLFIAARIVRGFLLTSEEPLVPSGRCNLRERISIQKKKINLSTQIGSTGHQSSLRIVSTYYSRKC